MAHRAQIVHHIPGKRIRLRVQNKRHDPHFFRHVKDKLHDIDGVKAEVRPETASVLVHYDGDFDSLLGRFAKVGLNEMLDVELGPAGEVASAFPLPLKLALLGGALVWGWYEAA